MKTSATFVHFEIKRDPVEPEEDSGLSEGQKLHPVVQISKAERVGRRKSGAPFVAEANPME